MIADLTLIDTLQIDSALVGDSLDLGAIASVESGDTMLDFGSDTLVLRNFTDLTLLENITDVI